MKAYAVHYDLTRDIGGQLRPRMNPGDPHAGWTTKIFASLGEAESFAACTTIFGFSNYGRRVFSVETGRLAPPVKR